MRGLPTRGVGVVGPLLRARAVLAVLAVTVLAVLPTTAAAGAPVTLPGAPVPDDPGRLLLLLDASGSMREEDAQGQAKVTAAKLALLELIPSLEPRALVGLRVYGASVPARQRAAACKDSELAVPLGAGNRAQLAAAVAGVEPLGETPIAYSLQQARKDLGPAGARGIVLVSDGEESCVQDACPAARQVGSTGIDVTIEVIGLGVDAAARRQLQCIAAAGRGRYYDAADADELSVSLRAALARASRAPSFNGTPVQGATAVTGAGPVLRPGLFSDRLGGRPSQRSYRLPTRSGATYHLSAALRPATASFAAQDGFRLRVLDRSGRGCAEEAVQRVRPGQVDSLMVAALALPVPADPRAATTPCGGAGPVTVVVARDTPQSSPQPGDTPYELLVIEEPPVTSTAGLPDVRPDPAPSPVAPRAPERETTGGSSLGLAATLTPGSWRDTVKPGETLVYRVRTQWGQRATVTVNALDGGPAVRRAAAGPNAVPIDVRVLSSGRSERRSARATGRYDGSGVALTAAGSTARYLNRQASTDGVHDLAGYQYFVVQAGASRSDYVVPLRLDVAVTGARDEAPVFAALRATPTATPTVTPAPRATARSAPGGGRVALLLGLSALAVGALGAAAWRIARVDLVLARRRRR